MHVSPTTWILTLVFVACLVVGDLVVNRNSERISLRHAAVITAIWTAIGLAFAGLVLAMFDAAAASQYLTGYLLERALSIDNVFVFVVILQYFAVPPRAQHRTLIFGVLVALMLRAVFIFGGLALLDRFSWMIYPFGALLLMTAVRLFTSGEEEADPEGNLALRFTKKLGFPPAIAILIVIGITDVVFAVDSIPAIFSVTRNSYLVFTSNAFAVLGLYALTFLLAQAMDRFAYLKHALAVVLALVGIKMLISGIYEINTWIALAIVAVILGAGIVGSLLATKPQA